MIHPIGNLRRFWSKVGVKFEVNEDYEPCGSRFCQGCQTGGHCWRRWPCWDWKADTNLWGYGRFKYKGKNPISSRMAWEFSSGNSPENFQVNHHCDNQLCCNPKHLFLGTQLDNMRDRDAKGRAADRRGEKHPLAKTTEQQVRCIRLEAENGALISALSKKYELSESQIFRIIKRLRWKHVS